MFTDPSAFRGNPWVSEEEESKVEPEEKTPEMIAQEREEKIWYVEPEEKTPEMIAQERKEKIQIWFWGSLVFIALFLVWAVYLRK